MYFLDLTVRKKQTRFISSHFYAAGGSVGQKVEQRKKNNKCVLAEGSKERL